MTKRKTRQKIQHRPAKPIRQKMSSEKEQEILGILLILFSLLLFFALFTFDAVESPATLNTGIKIHNGLGWAGVYLSHYLIRYTIGYPILVLPFLVFLWGWNRLLQKETSQLLRWSFFTLLFALYISIAFALHDAMSRMDGRPPDSIFSGVLGRMGAHALTVLLGPYGAVIVLIGIMLLHVLLISTFRLSTILRSVESSCLHVYYSISDRLFSLSRKKIHPKVTMQDYKEKSKLEPRDEPIINRRELSFPPIVDKPKNNELTARGEPAEEEMEDLVPESEPSTDLDFASQAEYEKKYQKPPLDLLMMPDYREEGISEEAYHMNARLLEEKLEDFGIQAQVVEIHPGPVITLYEMELAPGIRVARIVSLSDDLAMAMRAKRIRIVAPIPGKATIGIEIPNPAPEMVYMRELIDTPEFRDAQAPLTMAMGKTISGKPYFADLAKMPHLLVAGSTGSGKSVCLNTIITSMLYKCTPAEVQLVMIDPKRLELSNYAKLYQHHLNYVDGAKQKVATNAKTALQMLKSVELEMERRYSLLAAAGVRNIEEYNQRIKDGFYAPAGQDTPTSLYYLILIVDELADLMLTSGASRDVEEPIARLTQMSRAVGIHLILATQRPSVDVITGVIKANFPARIAFQVASKIDSRTILDMNGAEKLLGRGDMLFLPPGSPEPIRLHNAYISLQEIEQILEFVRHQPEFPKAPLAAYKEEDEATGEFGMEGGDRDPLFEEAMKIIVLSGQGSVSILQRKLKVGYSRAARLIDQLEEAGVVGPFEGSKAREVLMTPADLESMNLDEPSIDDEEL